MFFVYRFWLIWWWRPSTRSWEMWLGPAWRGRCSRGRGTGCWWVPVSLHSANSQDRVKQTGSDHLQLFSNNFSPQISDAVYKQVLSQTTGQYEALVEACEAHRAPLDARLRTDMDQIITSKEHVSNKIRGDSKHVLHEWFQPLEQNASLTFYC